MKKTVFVVEKDKHGFSAYAEDFEKHSIITMGVDLTELKGNILDAFNLQQAHNNKPLATIDDIALRFDIKSFFEYYDIISAKALSTKINMNNQLLSHYIKGVKKPSPKQVDKILNGLKEVGRELMELELA